MKADITRDTFNRLKYFSRVLLQQGRVQLDADWNEQVSILLDYLHRLTIDLIGLGAGPEKNCGFELIDAEGDINAREELSEDEKKSLIEQLKNERALIAPGRYYVEGLLAESESFVAFFKQPGWAVPKEDQDDIENGTINKALVYLDVWEQHVTPIEDDDIREKALGGPDTATRAKITWVVRARRLMDAEVAPANEDPVNVVELEKSFLKGWVSSQKSNRGLLKAQVAQHEVSEDPCETAPESVYRGVENQLYRVEIHREGLAANGANRPATFKWSRDNGSVAAAWLDTDGNVLRVTPLRDLARGFSEKQWVELSDGRRELEGRRGTLVQLKDVEAGSLTIDPQTASGSVDRSQFKDSPKVRRWDQQETETIKLNKGAIPIVEDKWITLEDGVQIQFQKPAETAEGVPGKPHQYRTGDYWLIPARVATCDIEWPIQKDEKGEPIRLALPPHGITHHFALLGLLMKEAAGNTFKFTDCRRKFKPLQFV